MPGVRTLYKTLRAKAAGTFSRAYFEPFGASAARWRLALESRLIRESNRHRIKEDPVATGCPSGRRWRPNHRRQEKT
jgi:hypothetical protein